MAEEQLIVKRAGRRRYSAYCGEIGQAPENLLARNWGSQHNSPGKHPHLQSDITILVLHALLRLFLNVRSPAKLKCPSSLAKYRLVMSLQVSKRFKQVIFIQCPLGLLGWILFACPVRCRY